VTAGVAAALWVGVGGATGAIARLVVDDWLGGRRATVVVNVLGSVALGAVTTAATGDFVRLAAGVGFCGAFTTFSSLAVGVADCLADGDVAGAVRYAGGTLLAALAGVAVGTALATSLG
jgi:CrcB protein